LTVILCGGISRGEDRLYHCPFCSFKSDDIEQFAIGMCWNCVYSEDAMPTEEGGIHEQETEATGTYRLQRVGS
jgi:hypothetical protein